MMYPYQDYSRVKERHDELLKEAKRLQLGHQVKPESKRQFLSDLYALAQKLSAHPGAKLRPIRR